MSAPRRRDGSVAQLAMLVGEMAIVFASGVLVYALIARASGPVLLGHYSLVLSWLTLFQAFAGFGIAEWVMREVGRAPEDGAAVGEALVVGLATSALASGAMLGAAALSGYDAEVWHAIAIAAIAPPAFTVSQLCRGAFVARGRSQHAFAIRLLEFLIVVPANAIQILHGAGVATLVATLVAGRVVGAIASVALLRAGGLHLALPSARPSLARLAEVAPFAVSQALGLLSTNLNLIMLSLFAPAQVLGFYAGSAKLVDVLLMCPTLVGTFLLPRLSAAAHPPRGAAHSGSLFEDPTTRRLLGGLFAVAVLACGGIAVFPAWVLRTLYGAELEPAAGILAALMLYCALVVADAMTSVVLKATGHQRSDVLLFAVNPALNAALNLLWIPSFGALGAAAASVVAVTASLVLRYRFVARRLGRPRWGALAARPLIGAAVMAAGAFLLRGRVADAILFALWTAASILLLARAVGIRAADLRRLRRGVAAEGSGS